MATARKEAEIHAILRKVKLPLHIFMLMRHGGEHLLLAMTHSMTPSTNQNRTVVSIDLL